MSLDYGKIKEAAQNYEKDMTKFLRDIVKFPGESCDEKAHIDRIAEEMRKLEFDKVEIDPMGNVATSWDTWEPEKPSSVLMPTSTPSGSETRTTGTLTPTKAMRTTPKSEEEAYPTSAAALYPPYMEPGS